MTCRNRSSAPTLESSLGTHSLSGPGIFITTVLFVVEGIWSNKTGETS